MERGKEWSKWSTKFPAKKKRTRKQEEKTCVFLSFFLSCCHALFLFAVRFGSARVFIVSVTRLWWRCALCINLNIISPKVRCINSPPFGQARGYKTSPVVQEHKRPLIHCSAFCLSANLTCVQNTLKPVNIVCTLLEEQHGITKAPGRL